MPNLVAGARVEREHLVRPCHVHDSVGHDRNGLQAEVPHILAIVRSVRQELRPERDGKGPLHAELAQVRLVDLREFTEAVSAHGSVERQPLAWLGIQDPGEIYSRVGTPSRGYGSGSYTAQS